MKTKPASRKRSLAPPKPAGQMRRTQTAEPEPLPRKAGRKARDPEASVMGDYDNMFESICDIASSIHAINQRAVREYAPIVEAILRSPIPDTRHIERTLDGLLDFCGYEPALRLYKKLCRHYYYINPTATVEYVEAYRDLWDSDQEAKP